MDSAIPSTSRRFVRALIAGGILAGGWFIADLVTAEPAAAAAQIDLVPSAEVPVSDLLDTVTSIAPVTAPLLSSLSPVVDPVTSTVDSVVAPLSPITGPILDPVRDSTQPVVDTVVAPVLEGTVAVITPIVEPVVEGLAPVVVVVVPALEGLVSTTLGNVAILTGQSGPAAPLAVLGALAVGVVSFAAGGPLAPTGRTPISPSPEGATAASGGFLGDLASGVPLLFGTFAPAAAVAAHPHASPVFESDTTPD